MKKRIVFFVLLIAVAIGMAFAENGRIIDSSGFGLSPGVVGPIDGGNGIYVSKVVETQLGVRIHYSVNNANKWYNKAKFFVTVIYEDGTEKTNSGTESIRVLKSGTLDLMFPRSHLIKDFRINIEYS
jgi:hypothetical protein